MLGFVYVDPEAGFTFNFESPLFVKNNQIYLGKKDSLSNIKYRLESNTAPVYILSDKQVEFLNLPKEPDWLKYYEISNDSVRYRVRLGYAFNHIGQSEIALRYLEQAYKEDPNYEGLEFELSYAYNALGQFERAISILKKAIENNPTNFWFYRELGYALMNSKDIEKAEEVYSKAIQMTNDHSQKAEIAINMTLHYFNNKDKPKFEEWANITKKYSTNNPQFNQYIKEMEDNWDNR